MIVYHYTSEDAFNIISTTRKFLPSYLNPQMDTAFGEGWYFSDLSPETEDNKLQQALWMRSEPTKCKRYLAFEIDDSLLQYCRPNVYRLKTETIADKLINIDLLYTFTSNQAQALKFLRSGLKPMRNRLNWLTGLLVLIGLGFLISKLNSN